MEIIMMVQNLNKIKRQTTVLRSLAFLMLSSSLSYASYELKEEDQKKVINAYHVAPNINERNIKIGIIDGHFDPNSDTRDALSMSTKATYKGKNSHHVAYRAQEYGGDHANHVSSSIHNVVPTAELCVIDLHNQPSLLNKAQGNARLIAALNEAMTSKVDFINISLRIAPDHNWDGEISQEVKAAFLRARDTGIGIIKSAGNDQEFTGNTAYTRSLVKLLEEMNGSMVLAAATQYDMQGQYEKLAQFSKGKMDLKTGKIKLDQYGHPIVARGSNLAGLAHAYTITAPGKNNYAYGASCKRIDRKSVV